MKLSLRSAIERRSGALMAAAAVSAVWLVGAAVLLAVLGADGGWWLGVAAALALPLVLVWFAALLAAHSAALDEELERLERRTQERPQGAEPARRVSGTSGQGPAPAPRPAPVARSAAGAPRPRQQPQPPASVPAAPRQRQEALPLGMEDVGVAIPLPELTRALDFPADEKDREGFRALHVALRDPRARRLVQASQDVLTLLSEEGIYMDDLQPARAGPELWRRFAQGERGAEVGKVGGIRDRSSLALTAGRLRSDPVFRDAAHHFLRLFDKALAEIAPGASDAQLAALADTRTARAFMLLGRVTGMFG